MSAQDLISDLGSSLGLPRLAAGTGGRCAVQLGSALVVVIEASDTLQEVLLCAHLGEVPAPRRREALASALVANTALAAAGPLRMAWRGPTHELALCLALRFDQLATGSLATPLEELARTARELRASLGELGLLST